MATVVFQSLGSTVGGPLGRWLGDKLGRQVDRYGRNLFSEETVTGVKRGPLLLPAAEEGAGLAFVRGISQVEGQIIWAARFRENHNHQGATKSHAAKDEVSYSLSFAVALCEGPVKAVRRIFADGQEMNLSRVTWRLMNGAETQGPDPLMVRIDGNAPAYRGVAVLVFEDLDLSPYGGRCPVISAEVEVPLSETLGPRLEDQIESVCLIPGSGEFLMAVTPVIERLSPLARRTLNHVQARGGQSDLELALDQIVRDLPNLKRIHVVVSWFGTDLRIDQCKILPGIEHGVRATLPWIWGVSGFGRGSAYWISQDGQGRANYGGTPDDRCILEAITAIKARGLKVVLVPFVLMDVPKGNGRPDPYGANEQGAFPWRGRITCFLAPGRAGSPDGTAIISRQVTTLFGNALVSDFEIRPGQVRCARPVGGLRQQVLHLAALGQAAGGVEAILIGSELRGITTLRDETGAYPAVRALRTLAADVRAMVGAGTLISYGADWSEYFGHQPSYSPGEVRFHLDDLWADPNIDFVGIDYYPPLTDWRGTPGELDAAAGYQGPHDPVYLSDRVTAGEGFEFYYASDADRQAQRRTPIKDTAFGEDFIYRPKDLLGWWSRPHYERRGGQRQGTPTAWVPRSKPLWLTEFGCGAIDKGANAPNLFLDPKSSESILPPFSSGARDDLGQRLCLGALLSAYGRGGRLNTMTTLTGQPMVAAMAVWCVDSRPYPAFPTRLDVWGDGLNWDRGHWLNGRLGGGSLQALITAVAQRSGITVRFGPMRQRAEVTGLCLTGPISAKEALKSLLIVRGLVLVEQVDGVLVLDRRLGAGGGLLLGLSDLVMPSDGPVMALSRRDGVVPDLLRLSYRPRAGERVSGLALARPAKGGQGPRSRDKMVDLHLPLTLSPDQADQWAKAALELCQLDPRGQVRMSPTVADLEIRFRVSPSVALRLEVGDQIRFDAKAFALLTGQEGTGGAALMDPVQDPAPDLSQDPGQDDGAMDPAILAAGGSSGSLVWPEAFMVASLESHFDGGTLVRAWPLGLGRPTEGARGQDVGAEAGADLGTLDPVLMVREIPALGAEGPEGGRGNSAYVLANQVPFLRCDGLLSLGGGGANPLRGALDLPCLTGQVVGAVLPGPVGQISGQCLYVRLDADQGPVGLVSTGALGLLNREGLVLVDDQEGQAELIGFARADLLADGRYVLSGLVRGLGSWRSSGLLGQARVIVLPSAAQRPRLWQPSLPSEWLGQGLRLLAAPRGDAPDPAQPVDQGQVVAGLVQMPLPARLSDLRRLGTGDLQFLVQSMARYTRAGFDGDPDGLTGLEQVEIAVLRQKNWVRSLRGSLPICGGIATYFLRDQIADFGGPVNGGLDLAVRGIGPLGPGDWCQSHLDVRGSR